MSKIITDIRQALELIETGEQDAAIGVLRDLDYTWEAELEASQDNKSTAEAYINGKCLLLQLLCGKAETPAIRKEIDTIYRTLILLAAQHDIRPDVIQAYAALLEKKKRFPCYELALADLYGLIAQYLQDEEKGMFRLAESAAYAERATNLCREHNPTSAETASAAFFFAQTLTKLGNWEVAIHTYQQSLMIYRRLKRFDSAYDIHLARVAQSLGHLQRLSGQTEASKNSYREAICHWKNHREDITCQVYLCRASVCLAKLLGPEDDVEAEDLLSEVIYQFRYGGRLAKEASSLLCSIYRRQGLEKEAAKLEKKMNREAT